MSRLTAPPKARVGLRDVATAAHVCVMTVSLALRGNPRISAPTRERIKRIADELGYHPDPELARLMNHLRVSRTTRGRLGIAIVDFYPRADFPDNPYNANVRAAATERAGELGLGVTTMHLADYDGNLSKLVRVIRARGIEGALLMPLLAPEQLDARANWDGISVVATSKSILHPRFHCIVPNQFGNMMRVFEAVHAAGFRRVAAIFDELFDERTGHNFTAAVSWNRQQDLTLIVPHGWPRAERAALVTDWIARHRPDVVFAQSDAVTAAIPALRRLSPRWPLQLIGLGAHNSVGYSYLDECAELIGAGAINMLGGMIYYHETGIPESPRTTLIEGRLVLTRRPGSRGAFPVAAAARAPGRRVGLGTPTTSFAPADRSSGT